MERRQFIKGAGAAGVCSCLVARALAADPASPTPAAGSASTPASAKPAPAEDWRVRFAKQRYSKFVTLVASRVDEKTFSEIVQEVGSFCAESGFSKKYTGKLDDYLAELRKRWGATAEHNPASNTVQLSFAPKNEDCACPLMGKGLVPTAACHCSIGSMRRSFATVVGHDVNVELKESVLQGAKGCTFLIRV